MHNDTIKITGSICVPLSNCKINAYLAIKIRQVKCCKNCNIKKVNEYDFDTTYLVMYDDDTHSNR